MKKLEEKILKDGVVKPGGILMIDSFLNHQIDPELYVDMAKEWKRLFDGCGVNKILTIEASGIGIAVMVANEFGCKALFAKKSKSKNISDNVYSSSVDSFTHGNTNTIVVSKDYLGPEDSVLIIDDFLANGAAMLGLIDLCNQAGAAVVGCGAAVEKTFQGGAKKISDLGYRVESLAKIASMGDSSITFLD